MKTKQFPETSWGISTLAGIDVGDVFMRSTAGYDYTLEILKCTHITAKQATIGTTKYRIEDCRQLGRDSWSRVGNLLNYNHEEYTANKAEQVIRRKRHDIGNLRWKDVSDESINAVWEIVKPLFEKKTA